MSHFLKHMIFHFYWLLIQQVVPADCSSALKTFCWTGGRNLWHSLMEAEGIIFSLYRMFRLVRATGAVAAGMVSYFIARLVQWIIPLFTHGDRGSWWVAAWKGKEIRRRRGAALAADAWCELSCRESSHQMFPEWRGTGMTYGHTNTFAELYSNLCPMQSATEIFNTQSKN